MSHQDRTAAKLEVSKVIVACRRTIENIENKRAVSLEKGIEYQQRLRRESWFFRWGWTRELSREDAEPLVGNGSWFPYHKCYAWGSLAAAERILALATATHALEMDVSSEDFEHVGQNYAV